MKLLFFCILLTIYYYLVIVVNGNGEASGKPLIEIIEGLVYQHEGRQYFRADIINNTESLEFKNVTLNCLDCYGNSDQYQVGQPLNKQSDGTYILSILPKHAHIGFIYNGPHSAQWYVVQSYLFG